MDACPVNVKHAPILIRLLARFLYLLSFPQVEVRFDVRSTTLLLIKRVQCELSQQMGEDSYWRAPLRAVVIHQSFPKQCVHGRN